MSIGGILASGFQLTVDLLTDLPSSSDHLTWPRVIFSSGRPIIAVAVITNPPPNCMGTIDVDIPDDVHADATAAAFGVLYQGGCLFVGPCAPFYLQRGFKSRFRIQFVVYPFGA